MRRAVACGIDFGTSNSTVSVAYDDGSVELVPVSREDTPTSLPSLIYIHRDLNQQTGEGAIQEYLLTGADRTKCLGCERRFANPSRGLIECGQQYFASGCNDSRLMHGLKFELANDLFTRTHSWGRDYTPDGLLAIVLRSLKRSAEMHAGMQIDNVVLGKPIGFVGAELGAFDELQELAVGRLVAGAQHAGFSSIETFYEPEAAGQIAEPPIGTSVVLDFGGGTFDVAVLSRESPDAAVRVTGLQGAPVGGSEFDGLLFENYVWEQLGVRKTDIPGYWKRLRTLSEVRWLLADRGFAHTIALARKSGVDTRAIETIVFGGQAYAFYRQIERAKVDLSQADEARISFSRPGISVSAKVTRHDFERLIEPLLCRVEAAIDRALDEAKVDATAVAGVMVTGGSSRTPAFLHMARKKFSNAQAVELPPFTAVAEGLGRRAVALWS